MKLRKRTYYGIKSVLALLEATSPIPTHILAEAENIPPLYLEKILQDLRRAGIVTAIRGTTGGYQAARKGITLWEVVDAMEGGVEIPTTNHKGLPCNDPHHCQAMSLWHKLNATMAEELNRPIASLVPKHRK